jgi:hypothetical protein
MKPRDTRRDSQWTGARGTSSLRHVTECTCELVVCRLRVPIAARKPDHPGGYASLPTEVYRIWCALANIAQCCVRTTDSAVDPSRHGVLHGPLLISEACPGLARLNRARVLLRLPSGAGGSDAWRYQRSASHPTVQCEALMADCGFVAVRACGRRAIAAEDGAPSLRYRGRTGAGWVFPGRSLGWRRGWHLGWHPRWPHPGHRPGRTPPRSDALSSGRRGRDKQSGGAQPRGAVHCRAAGAPLAATRLRARVRARSWRKVCVSSPRVQT